MRWTTKMVEFKVIKAEEKNNRLSVEIEVEEKTESFAFPITDMEPHHETNKPMFIHKIKEILDRKYNPKKAKNTKKSMTALQGITYNTDKIEDMSKKAQAQARKQLDKQKGDKCAEKLHKAEWDKVDADLEASRLKRREDKDKIKIERQFQEIAKKSTLLKHCEDGSCNI